jgi:hypothetical protein
MLWVVDGIIIERSDAWGGETPDPTVAYNVMKPRPTTPGKYVIHSYAPYRTNTWPLSKIAWGTRLKVQAGEILFETGERRQPWRKLKERLGPAATLDAIKREYWARFADSGKYDLDGDLVPDVWIFNDFGPMAVRYYRDANRDRRLSKGEALSGEMIHTTPDNETEAALGKPVVLMPSHGCIHVSPAARDRLHAAGAFARGNDLVIYEYSEAVPPKVE